MTPRHWTIGHLLLQAGLPLDTQVAIVERDGLRVAHIPDGQGFWWALLPAIGSEVMSCGWLLGSKLTEYEVRIEVAKLASARPTTELAS